MLRKVKENIKYCYIIFNDVMKFSTKRSKQLKKSLNNPLKAKYNIHVSTSKKLKCKITCKSSLKKNKIIFKFSQTHETVTIINCYQNNYK